MIFLDIFFNYEKVGLMEADRKDQMQTADWSVVGTEERAWSS